MKAKDITVGTSLGQNRVVRIVDSAHDAKDYGNTYAERRIIWYDIEGNESGLLIPMNLWAEADVEFGE